MEKYPDFVKQITEFLDNMDENDYMQSFLYFLDFVENDLTKAPKEKESDDDGHIVFNSETRESEVVSTSKTEEKKAEKDDVN